jgi:hypothetical protein
MTEGLLDVTAYQRDTQWIDRATGIVAQASEQDLDFLVMALSRAQITELVVQNPSLAPPIWRGSRAAQIPKDAHSALARFAKGKEPVCRLLLLKWMEYYYDLVDTLARIEANDPRQAIVQLARLTGERDWHKLVWTLRLDPRPTIEKALAGGLWDQANHR